MMTKNGLVHSGWAVNNNNLLIPQHTKLVPKNTNHPTTLGQIALAAERMLVPRAQQQRKSNREVLRWNGGG